MKWFCCFLIVVLLFIITCAQKEEKLAGEQGGTVVIGSTDLPTTISPLAPSMFGSNEILDLLFMHLHSIDPETGKMKPELASSWEFSEDLTSITYYLRRDVEWWDGKSVTAEDVYYTYEKMIDPKTNYPNIAKLRFIKKAELVGTYAIKFTFDRVYADLLTDSDIMAVPKHIVEKSDDNFGQNPIGNGPYKIKEWIYGSELILVANDKYYRGKPPLDEIHIRYYYDMNNMIDDFANGDLDLVLNITPTKAKDLEKNENIAIDSRPGNTYTYIGWNLNHPFLNDKDVRKALSMAINTNKILDEVFAGIGVISLGPLPLSSWGYNENIEPIEYDLSKAKEILENKGFRDRNRNKIIDKDGKEFVLNIITNIENSDRVATLDYITKDLTALGIRIRTRTLNTASFIDVIVKREFDGFIMGWSTGAKIDPTIYWNSDPAKGLFNFVSYANSVVDSLIDVGVAMLNRKKAKKIWNEFQRIVYQDQPYTFLIVSNNVSASYKRIRGVDNGITLANAYTYWIPEAEQRVAVAALTSLGEDTTSKRTGPEIEPVGEAEKPPEVVKPEELLEAAVKKDTASVVDIDTTGITAVPLAPPKPSVITRATPVKQVTPKYPESARTISATGRVVIRVLVGTDGKVKTTTVLSSFGNPACEVAAVAAAKQWEFKPATKDGEPFEQRITIPFDFRPPR